MAVAALAVVLFSTTAEAGPIGTFTIVGTGNVRVGNSWIDWGTPGPTFEGPPYTNCEPGPNPGACVIDGTTFGSILFTGGTGDFAALGGTTGEITDLEDDFAPVGTAFSLSNFIVASADPTLDFILTMIPNGTGTPAGCTSTPGDVCTIPGSPFTITNNADGTSTIGLVVRGQVIRAGDPLPSTFLGLFSTQLNTTAAGALAQLATVGWIQSSHSAEFTVTTTTIVPEPGTIVLFGGGVLLLGLARFLRRRSAEE